MKNTILKLTAAALLCAMSALCFTACSNNGEGSATETPTKGEPATRVEVVTDESGEAVTNENGEPATIIVTEAPAPDTDEPATGETETAAPAETVFKLTFNGNGLTGAPEGSVEIDKDAHAFVIVKPGTYELTGDITGGQLQVKVDKTEKVTLIFNNFNAASSTSAPLYIVSGDKITIELADGSTNRLTDAATYIYPDPTTDKPNACLYSAVDLKIKGKGALLIEGSYNNGIGVKKDLEIKNGIITVTGPNNIIKGGNSVTISGGTLTLSGGEDGIKSDEETKEGKGFVLITGDAVVSITCADDAIQASQAVTIDPTARVTTDCGGDPVNCPGIITIPDSSALIEK